LLTTTGFDSTHDGIGCSWASASVGALFVSGTQLSLAFTPWFRVILPVPET
jgi:hypothetical protein